MIAAPMSQWLPIGGLHAPCQHPSQFFAPHRRGLRLPSLGLRRRIQRPQEPDTRTETARLFQTLAEGGEVEMPLQDMFWGACFGSLKDRYGVQWMFNCAEAAAQQ